MAALDLPFLPSFLAIYEAGSLTAAASQLRRTQPTVSYQLARLEDALGAALFERRGRRLVPVVAAHRLYRATTRFASQLADLQHGEHAGEGLAIAAVSVFGRYVLFPRVRAMIAPGWSLRFPAAEEVLRQVLDGSADLGFTFRDAARSRLELVPAYTEHYVLAAGAAWARRLATPRAFRDAHVITYDESDYVVGRWLGYTFGRRTPPWKSVAHFEELEEVMDCVAAGVGVAVVPSCLISTRRWRVTAVGWNRPGPENVVYAVQRSDAPPRAEIAAVLASLRTTSRHRP